MKHLVVRRIFIAAAFVVLSAAPRGPAAAGQSVGKEDGYARRGRELYVVYCAACHGTSGRGDGFVSSALKTAPADLTSLTQKYGTYPIDRVMTWIDGEKAATSHGSREMPVWGQRFRSEEGQAAAFGDVYALARFLRSIQNRPSPVH